MVWCGKVALVATAVVADPGVQRRAAAGWQCLGSSVGLTGRLDGVVRERGLVALAWLSSVPLDPRKSELLLVREPRARRAAGVAGAGFRPSPRRPPRTLRTQRRWRSRIIILETGQRQGRGQAAPAGGALCGWRAKRPSGCPGASPGIGSERSSGSSARASTQTWPSHPR